MRKHLGFLAILASGCHQQASPKQIHSAESHYAICADSLAKHQLEAAKSECDKAIKFNPDMDTAYNARGLVALMRAGETERSLEIDQCLTGLDAESTRRDLDKALHEADIDFELAATMHPDYSEAWVNRGIVHNLLEDYTAAEGFLLKALENPARLENPGLARSHLGWAYLNEKKPVDAARELRQALQFQPKMCVANYRLGRVYFAREEWDKAADLFQSVSDDTSCGSQEASLYLMKARLAQGLVDDARNARDACLKISPKSCLANQCIADGAGLGGMSVASKPSKSAKPTANP